LKLQSEVKKDGPHSNIFEIPTNAVEKLKRFYENVFFDWKIIQAD
jgi:predicted enzyme related to lactoylglutathione lyase